MRGRILLVLLYAGSAFAQAPQVLSLEDAVAIGKRNSKLLQIADAKAYGAEAKAGEAEAALLPALRFSGIYTHLSKGDFTLNVAPTGEASAGSSTSGRAVPIAPVVQDNFTLRVAVFQPLFTGFRLSSNSRAAEYAFQASILERQMTGSDLILNVTTAYWTLYQARETRKLVGENVARLEAYLADTQRLMQTGMATRNDQLKMEVQLANARLLDIDATNDARLACMNLNSLIGQPLETEIVPGSSPDALLRPDSLASADDDMVALPGKALSARRDLQAAALLREAAREGVSAARGGYWPQVDLSAGYNYNRPNSRYQPVTPEFLGGWDIGVQVQLDIWNWGRTACQAEQAEAILRQSEHQLGQLRDNVVLEVNRATLGTHRASEKVSVARLGVVQADENVRVTNDRYRNGLATSSELLDAEVAVLQAKTNLTGATVEYAVTATRLARALGEL